MGADGTAGSLCLDISLFCPARLARTDISHCRTTSRAKGRCRSTSLASRWCVFPPLGCGIADVRWYSTARVRISSRRTCTSQRIAYVFLLSHLLTVPLTPLRAPDPVLGARLKAWRRVDPALRQVGVRSDGCARSGARTDLAAPPLAQRLVLRRCALDGALPLPVPLEPHFCQEGVDPR